MSQDLCRNTVVDFFVKAGSKQKFFPQTLIGLMIQWFLILAAIVVSKNFQVLKMSDFWINYENNVFSLVSNCFK